jgi:hypothetical protein
VSGPLRPYIDGMVDMPRSYLTPFSLDNMTNPEELTTR